MDLSEKLTIPPFVDHARSLPLVSKPKRERIASKDHSTRADAVHLTNHGRSLKSAMERSRQISDVREDRINALKQQIEQGTYRVQKDWIASNLMAETMENNQAMESLNGDG